jgi:CDP-diacylglycerol--serine O-phosphatidyltransferase
MKKRVTRSIVPNLLTLANLFSGFTAIIYFSHGEFQRGAFFILAAAIFDMLDGVMARLIHSTSEFGVALDSLCDAVSFGVAPSFMLYQVFFSHFGEIGILPASLPALAGVVRLARFNIQFSGYEDKKYFTGLPIPSGAFIIVSYVIFFHLSGDFSQGIKDVMIIIVSIIVPLAMVSRIKHDNLPRPTKRSIKERPAVFVIFVLGLIGSVVTRGKFIFPFMMFYLMASAVKHFIFWLKKVNRPEDDIDESQLPDLEEQKIL